MFDDNSYRTIAWVVAALSMIGNAFICISCHLCETLSRDGVYNLIYWESLSALFYSLAFLLGRPINGSANCTVQALMFQYFGLASMLSIFLILYHMNNLIKRENVQVASLDVQRRYTFKITWKSYILVWVSPLLLMVVPFATDSYGQADIGNRNRSICWIRLEKWTDLYVMLCVYYIPLVIIFIFCMYHVITIVWRTWSKSCTHMNIYIYIYMYMLFIMFDLSSLLSFWIGYGHHTVTSYIRRLTLYPIIFFVCSIPGVYMRADVAINPEKEYEIW